MRRWRDGNGRRFWALAAAVALLAGCSGGKKPGAAINDALEPMFPPAPGEVARDAFNVYDPDKRRRSVNLLSTADFGGEAEYLRTYRLLVDDPDPTVRAACLRALGRHGTPEDVSRITPYLEDENVFVRWEAARALQRIQNELAIDPLITALRDDTASEVRQACASALAQYPRSRVFQALVGALSDDDFAVIQQAVQSLKTLTGEDFGESGSEWLSWADRQDDLFADKQPYYYPQYDAPRSFWSKLKFWSSPEPPEPRQPRRQVASAAPPQADPQTTEASSEPASPTEPESAAAADGADSSGSSADSPPAATAEPDTASRSADSGAGMAEGSGSSSGVESGSASSSGSSSSSQAPSDGQASASESSRPESSKDGKAGDGDEDDEDAEAWRRHILGASDGKK